MEHANSIPPYHPATFGSSNPRIPSQPTFPQIQPPFPSPQYDDVQDPAPFAMQWNVSSPNPPSSIGSGFTSPGDYGNFPASPPHFPVPSTDHVPVASIYHPTVAFPEPHGGHLSRGPDPYPPILPTRIQSLSSLIAPTIQMPEPQPSVVPQYPEYMQRHHQQQNIWDQGNLAYQSHGHSRTDSHARDQGPAEYGASGTSSSWVPHANPPESDYPGSHAQNRTENHHEQLSQRQSGAFAREHSRLESHRSPSSQRQPQVPILEQSRPTNHSPLRVPSYKSREREQHSSVSRSEQRQNEHLRPPSSPRSSPAHSIDRRHSQFFRPPLSPRSVGSEGPPSYTSSPQLSTTSPRPYVASPASPPAGPGPDSGRIPDMDALTNQMQHGMDFNLQPPSQRRANGSHLSGTTMTSGASGSSASNVDHSERRVKNERLPASQKENYRPDFAYGGMKKALLIGINYTRTPFELKGCIIDVHRTYRFLIEYGGYRKRNIVLLTDDSSEPESLPTRDNIIRCMKALVENAERDDTLFFHYSGHGSQIPDEDDDEDDGMDETIKPLDYEVNGDIVDDELHEILVKPLPDGCRLTALVDSCHSGTILDLPYVYCSDRNTRSIRLEVNKKGLHKATSSDVILFAGCMDAETSEDTIVNGLPVGAMSWAFTDALKENPNQTYQELFNNISKAIKYKHHQTPLLSASHKIDLNKRFVY
ncbi:hypothetical protein HYPSUDRAFT_44100 [Hypholoma sublateritium FD-334 SS-4]|uniref:Peptidase C14 caspase domain-containing protein n=1 Tax=Hypholoma sublateritium (strain FD-334 SS-4) TaxID=945553 RepID=A0A0D2NSB4_HYPSF|nr:hypothetical protein HYPSUDRAFT_44100 [Hypholoma sublateritium FD-334 SS-4]